MAGSIPSFLSSKASTTLNTDLSSGTIPGKHAAGSDAAYGTTPSSSERECTCFRAADYHAFDRCIHFADQWLIACYSDGLRAYVVAQGTEGDELSDWWRTFDSEADALAAFYSAEEALLRGEGCWC